MTNMSLIYGKIAFRSRVRTILSLFIIIIIIIGSTPSLFRNVSTG